MKSRTEEDVTRQPQALEVRLCFVDAGSPARMVCLRPITAINCDNLFIQKEYPMAGPSLRSREPYLTLGYIV